jgi:hypothetical protein
MVIAQQGHIMNDKPINLQWRDGTWRWTQPYVQYSYRPEPEAAPEVWNIDSEVTDLAQARAVLARIMSL